MNGFTPGPWRWASDVRTGEQNRTALAMRFLIAANGQGFAHTFGLIAEDGNDAANADLMAAAPDLLAALEACEETMRLIHNAAGVLPQSAPMPEHSTFGAWQLATAAISKARGLNPDATPTKEEVSP